MRHGTSLSRAAARQLDTYSIYYITISWAKGKNNFVHFCETLFRENRKQTKHKGNQPIGRKNDE